MNNPGCDETTCQLKPGFSCNNGSICAFDCGNGLEPNGYDFTAKLCDDGNMVNGDGCSSTC